MKKHLSKFKTGFIAFFLLTSVVYAAMTYHGNSKSHIFHRPGCRYYECKNCTMVFSSRDDAVKAGFRPCKVCKP